jgi:hypothetical protein
MDQDLELFFKDFGATLKQTVDLARGVEENVSLRFKTQHQGHPGSQN